MPNLEFHHSSRVISPAFVFPELSGQRSNWCEYFSVFFKCDGHGSSNRRHLRLVWHVLALVFQKIATTSWLSDFIIQSRPRVILNWGMGVSLTLISFRELRWWLLQQIVKFIGMLSNFLQQVARFLLYRHLFFQVHRNVPVFCENYTNI